MEGQAPFLCTKLVRFMGVLLHLFSDEDAGRSGDPSRPVVAVTAFGGLQNVRQLTWNLCLRGSTEKTLIWSS